MEEVIRLDTIEQYNKIYGLETLHPLVAVADLSKATQFPTRATFNFGVYALYLKQTKCGDLRYGKQIYDYQEGTVTSFSPGQVVGVQMEKGTRPISQGLIFHPDLIRGTSLAQEIKGYSFFAYDSHEALHLSDEEKQIFRDCLDHIRQELVRPCDKYSKRLISRHIELLLDYCLRFYERQFVTRQKANKDIGMKLEDLLDAYFHSDKAQREGLPSVKYFADGVHLSSNYFGDLVKKETGRLPRNIFKTN